MKKLALALALSIVAQSTIAATFNLFSPATGVLVGNSSTYITTPANSSHIVAMWSGTCNSTTFLRGDGSCVAVTTAPGGSTTQVQFNNAGTFAGDSGLTYNSGTDTLAVTGDVTIAGQSVCQEDGTNCPASSAVPGGSDTQVQFNDGGAFGGDAGFTYNKTTEVLSVTNGLEVEVGGVIQINNVDVCLQNGTNCPATSGVVSVGGADYVSPTCTTISVGGSCMASYGGGGVGTSRASTGTMTPDPVLVLNDLPAGNYRVAGCLNVAYGAGGMRTAIYVNPTKNSYVIGQKNQAGLALQEMTLPGGSEWVITAGGSGSGNYCFEGRFTNSGSIGDWGITWAQASSNAAATVMNIHSYVIATRLN